MKTKIVSIGAIVKYKEIKMMVVGYGVIEKNEKVSLAYAVMSYPIGYKNSESIRYVSCEDVQVLHPGYESELSEVIVRYEEGLSEILGSATKEQLTEILAKN